jgi:hypothetical protein
MDPVFVVAHAVEDPEAAHREANEQSKRKVKKSVQVLSVPARK